MKNESTGTFRPLLLGGGKLARHLHHLLSQKGIPHAVHSDARVLNPDFFSGARACSHVWLLVSDHALQPLAFSLRNLLPGVPLVHSSASTPIEGALTLHPLMTFGPELYSEAGYDDITWTLFQEELEAETDGARKQIENFLGRLPNPIRILSSHRRTQYHLSCVMFSNLSILLWEAAARTAPAGMRPSDYRAILERTLENFLKSGMNALTGPLVRGDQETLMAHQRLLGDSPEAGLYAAFCTYYSKMNPSPEREALHVDHST